MRGDDARAREKRGQRAVIILLNFISGLLL